MTTQPLPRLSAMIHPSSNWPTPIQLTSNDQKDCPIKSDWCWICVGITAVLPNELFIYCPSPTYFNNKLVLPLRGGADKSLAQPTSRCRRTESIVTLERGACSCAELQVFSCYRGWKEARQVTRANFNNIETWAVIKFFFLQGKAPKEIHAILIETLGEHAPSYATFKNWVTQFKRDFSTCNVPRPGWPKTVTTPEIIDQMNKLILEDRWILAKSISEQLGISRERVGSNIHEDFDMRKLFAKWVPKCLKADHNRQWCLSSEQLLQFFQCDPHDFLLQLVTVDETWIYHYDPETKQQSMEWQHSGSPRPQKFRV